MRVVAGLVVIAASGFAAGLIFAEAPLALSALTTASVLFASFLLGQQHRLRQEMTALCARMAELLAEKRRLAVFSRRLDLDRQEPAWMNQSDFFNTQLGEVCESAPPAKRAET